MKTWSNFLEKHHSTKSLSIKRVTFSKTNVHSKQKRQSQYDTVLKEDLYAPLTLWGTQYLNMNSTWNIHKTLLRQNKLSQTPNFIKIGFPKWTPEISDKFLQVRWSQRYPIWLSLKTESLKETIYLFGIKSLDGSGSCLSENLGYENCAL